MAAGFLVERLGRHVGAVRPRDRAGVGIDGDAREERRVAERLEDTAPLRPAKSTSPTVPSANVSRS
jgi:hypothetical protein